MACTVGQRSALAGFELDSIPALFGALQAAPVLVASGTAWVRRVFVRFRATRATRLAHTIKQTIASDGFKLASNARVRAHTAHSIVCLVASAALVLKAVDIVTLGAQLAFPIGGSSAWH